MAILAADAVGYSQLMAADDVGTLRTLEAARHIFRSLVEAHHGRIVDMAGDSVLAVFNTAPGAANAALDIQLKLNAPVFEVPVGMRFRIGVHVGDLLKKDDGTVYGDGVNIAARLQSLAKPGAATASESVIGTIRESDRTAWSYAGQQFVKGIPYTVRFYRSVAVAATGGTPQTNENRELSVSLNEVAQDDYERFAATSFSDITNRLLGVWMARVCYGWGDSYDERFEFIRHAGRLFGTGDFLGFPRVIENLNIDGLNIHFQTHSISAMGNETRELTRTYAVELRGRPPDEVLAIRMHSSGGFSSEKPLEFQARRAE